MQIVYYPLTLARDKIILATTNMTSGMIFDIKRYAINDGPGIRTAIFMKGCPLKCWWCHNPEGQSLKPQLIFRANRCKSAQACLQACPRGAISWKDGSLTDWENCDQCGKCAEACFSGAREMVGRKITVDELMDEVMRDVPFYDQSGGGVTFTGGEPLFQAQFLREMLQASKRQGLHTTVDTSGQTSWTILESIFPLVDLFLYDVKHMDTQKHSKYTSVPNRKILANLSKLAAEKARIIVRLPLIPGVNDDPENLRQTATFLAALPGLQGVELMPYHEIGVAKYRGLGMRYKMNDTLPMNRDQINKIEEILATYKLPISRHASRRIL